MAKFTRFDPKNKKRNKHKVQALEGFPKKKIHSVDMKKKPKYKLKYNESEI